MHRLLTRRDLYCYLAIPLVIVLAGSCASLVDKPPSLRIPAPPAKTFTVLHTKPTLPDKTEEVKLPIPLDDELVNVLVEVCEADGVPLALAVAVMEQESEFDVDIVSSKGCYGLMQLNPQWFPSGLSPKMNIWVGVGYLGELLATYDTTAAAVTAYFYGPSERTSSWYSDEVLERAAQWQERMEGIE